MAGLLIVNADDLGGNRLATDRILRCFEDGVITSATAMVYMSDSDRAAELVRDTELPIGLHLNLTQIYDAPDVPDAVRRRHDSVVCYMADPRRRRSGLAPTLIRPLRATISDQLDRFQELYGHRPTHVDGHNHAHLNPTALLCLPGGLPVRPSHRRSEAPHSPFAPTSLRDRWLRARHPSVDRFFPLVALHPALDATGFEGLEQALGLARTSSVEVMVHPDRGRADQVLRSSRWIEAISDLRLGGYDDLLASSATPSEPPTKVEQP